MQKSQSTRLFLFYSFVDFNYYADVTLPIVYDAVSIHVCFFIYNKFFQVISKQYILQQWSNKVMVWGLE